MTKPLVNMPPPHPRAPYWRNTTSTLYVGDAREVLAEMPDESADCIVTSPPYWGKRDYRVAGQYGHEQDPAAYVDTLRATFAEARRVLADDGTCWLNLGDSYSAGGGGASGLHAYLGRNLAAHRDAYLPPKNLLGLPWRVAFALQDDGWILRNAIVWHKPNAMPESVRDRLNCRYELMFLLVKQSAYWFDLDPIRIPRKPARAARPPRRAGKTRTGRRSMARTPARSSAPSGTAPAEADARTRTAVIPATYGRYPPGPTPGHTSPRSPSSSRGAASPPDASRAAPCWTCSPARAPPAWLPSSSAGASPASSYPLPSRASPPNGSAKRARQIVKQVSHDRPHTAGDHGL